MNPSNARERNFDATASIWFWQTGLRGRTIPTEFIILPDAQNRTLLGVHFTEDAGLILDLPSRRWWFRDQPEAQHPFYSEGTPSQPRKLIPVQDRPLYRGTSYDFAAPNDPRSKTVQMNALFGPDDEYPEAGEYS
ncbi:hypothetical protein FQR65_LT16106 [Abscondita terminalis]|nr:hypothetical protein FQR65_LT16106 [Abscondita terminalis]